MISRHCGERVQYLDANKLYFRVRCRKCGEIFKQRKRQPTKQLDLFKKGEAK